LLPHALEFLFDVGRVRIRCCVCILGKPALFHCLFDFFFTLLVERDAALTCSTLSVG
jgi:hypothetical protein